MADRGNYRSTHAVLLDTREFQELPRDAKHIFHALKQSRFNNAAGIFVFGAGEKVTLCEYTSISTEEIDMHLWTLHDGRWVFCEGGLCWLRNQLKFDPHINLKNENHAKTVLKVLSGLPAVSLVAKFCNYYGLDIPSDIPSRYHQDTIPDQDTDTDKDTEKEEEGNAARKNVDNLPKARQDYEQFIAQPRNKEGLRRVFDQPKYKPLGNWDYIWTEIIAGLIPVNAFKNNERVLNVWTRRFKKSWLGYIRNWIDKDLQSVLDGKPRPQFYKGMRIDEERAREKQRSGVSTDPTPLGETIGTITKEE